MLISSFVTLSTAFLQVNPVNRPLYRTIIVLEIGSIPKSFIELFYPRQLITLNTTLRARNLFLLPLPLLYDISICTAKNIS